MLQICYKPIKSLPRRISTRSMSVSGYRLYLFCFIATLLALCINGILGKNQMEIRLVSAQLEYANPDMVGPGAFFRVMRKTRKGIPILNALFPFIKDLPVDTNISWHSFQKVNNAWTSTLIKGSMNLCSMLEKGNKLQRMFFDSSNFPSKCPIKKGNYTIKDFYINTNGMPPVIPGSDWKNRGVWSTSRKNFLVYYVETKFIRKDGKELSGSEAAAALLMNG